MSTNLDDANTGIPQFSPHFNQNNNINTPNNPFQGNDLGGHLHKVRLGVDSKGRGKSGGMRVITYTVEQLSDETIEITLLYIYDKSEMSAVSPQFLRWLLSQENI